MAREHLGALVVAGLQNVLDDLGQRRASDGRDIANSVLPAEIWNPDTETWTTVD